MGLSDCLKCWGTLCTCGHEYRDWSTEEWNHIGSCYSEMKEWCSEVNKELKDVSIERIKKKLIVTFSTFWKDEKFIYEQDWKYIKKEN